MYQSKLIYLLQSPGKIVLLMHDVAYRDGGNLNSENSAEDSFIDLTKILEEKNINEIEMVEMAENFFISLGFQPLSETFWERSSLAIRLDYFNFFLENVYRSSCFLNFRLGRF